MDDLFRDLPFGARMLSRSPVFTTAAALLLAIGISANTLIFSIIDAWMLVGIDIIASIAVAPALCRSVRIDPASALRTE